MRIIAIDSIWQTQTTTLRWKRRNIFVTLYILYYTYVQTYHAYIVHIKEEVGIVGKRQFWQQSSGTIPEHVPALLYTFEQRQILTILTHWQTYNIIYIHIMYYVLYTMTIPMYKDWKGLEITFKDRLSHNRSLEIYQIERSINWSGYLLILIS